MSMFLMKMAVFTQRKCVLRLDRYGSSGYFFFEKHSLIDFQIGKGRKREFRAAELRFFQELSFYIPKKMNSWGRCVRKWRFSNEETAFAGYNCFFRSQDRDAFADSRFNR